MTDRLRNALKRVNRKLAAEEWLYGLVGKITASGPVYDVPGRAGFIYVRLRNANGAQTTPPARNDPGVPHSAGLPVRMYYEGTTLVIDSVSRRPDLATVDPPPASGVPVHIHDDRYFRENEHVNASAGATDAAKPVVLDAGGKLDATLIDAEDIQDIVGAMVSGGTETNIAVTYDDTNGRLDFVVSTNSEEVQDAIGAILGDSTTIDFTYSDATPSITAIVIDDSITNAKLANVPEATVKGSPLAAGTVNPVDLTAAQLRAIANVADGADVTGAAITALAAKTTPVDADAVVITDSAASDAPKRTLWSDIKATLVAAFVTNGTWSPAITGSVSNPTVTYSENVGRYTIFFGVLVIYSLRVAISSYSGGSGDLRISLPFVSANINGADNVRAAALLSGIDVQAGSYNAAFRPVAGQAYGVFQTGADNTAAVIIAIADAAGSDSLAASGFYWV